MKKISRKNINQKNKLENVPTKKSVYTIALSRRFKNCLRGLTGLYIDLILIINKSVFFILLSWFIIFLLWKQLILN